MKKIAKSVYEGELSFPVIDFSSGEQYFIKAPCANLDNNLRVINERAFLLLLARSAAYTNIDKESCIVKLPPFLNAENLKPFVIKCLTVSSNPVSYINKTNHIVKGYLAELLPEVCQIYRVADREGALRKSQMHIAERCDLITDALLKVSIAALIDEATGYQDVRPKDNLQAMLELYLEKQAQPWKRQFAEDFYKEIHRLKNWKYTPNKRPSCLGNITVDIVYERIQPRLWDELKNVNPDKKKFRYFQFLSESIGNPHFQEHLRGLIRIMKGSSNWNMFYASLEHFYPKTNSVQMDIFFDLLVQSPEDLEKYKDLVS